MTPEKLMEITQEKRIQLQEQNKYDKETSNTDTKIDYFRLEKELQTQRGCNLCGSAGPLTPKSNKCNNVM